MHLWLAPFTPGRQHVIELELGRVHRLAMVRVWNYNKSRIHSFRGAREVEMSLDGRCIFRGEIAKASGTLSGGKYQRDRNSNTAKDKKNTLLANLLCHTFTQSCSFNTKQTDILVAFIVAKSTLTQARDDFISHWPSFLSQD